MAHLYPIYLDISGKNCLVVGGGKVAGRKVLSLMEYGANITVVSPQAEDNIRGWSAQGSINWFQKEFEPGDLDGIFMVFVATDNNETNRKVAGLCRQKGIMVNAVDDPPNCDFYVPSILRRNSLTLAISTEGKSPLYAAKLRRELEEIITDAYGEYVDLLGELRSEIMSSGLTMEQRRTLFEELINSDILELIKINDKDKVEERIKQCMSSWRG